MDVDRDMERFQRGGLDSRQLSKLVRNLNNWIDYIPKMSFPLTDERMLRVTITDDVSEIRDKWRRISRNAPQKRIPDTPKAVSRSEDREAYREKARQEQETREQQVEDAIKNAEMAIYKREMEVYRAALAKYEQAEKKAKQEQDAHFQRLCANARGNRLEEAIKTRDKIITRAESEIQHQRQRIEQAELALGQLKFWNFKKKSEQQKILAHAEQIVSEKQAEISRAKQTCQNECSSVESFVKQRESQFLQQVQFAHPIPAKPAEPQKLVSDPTGRMSQHSLQNARLARILLDRMENGTGYTGAELATLLEDVYPQCNSSKVSAIMRHIDEGRVTYERVEGKNVYHLKK